MLVLASLFAPVLATDSRCTPEDISARSLRTLRTPNRRSSPPMIYFIAYRNTLCQSDLGPLQRCRPGDLFGAATRTGVRFLRIPPQSFGLCDRLACPAAIRWKTCTHNM